MVGSIPLRVLFFCGRGGVASREIGTVPRVTFGDTQSRPLFCYSIFSSMLLIHSIISALVLPLVLLSSYV